MIVTIPGSSKHGRLRLSITAPSLLVDSLTDSSPSRVPDIATRVASDHLGPDCPSAQVMSWHLKPLGIVITS